MDLELNLIRANKAIEHLEKAMIFLNYNDNIDIQKIINNKHELIKHYNNQNLKVINPTKGELGSIRSSLKKIVFAEYFNPIVKKEREKYGTYKFSYVYIEHNPIDNFCECDNCNNENHLYSDNFEKINLPLTKLRNELFLACQKTEIPKEIIDAKILLSRKNPNYWLGKDKLDWELSEYLKIKMLEAFNKQNASFIKEKLTIKT